MTTRRLLAALILLAMGLHAGAADEWGFDPRFRPLPAVDVLVKGEPPLLRRDVDAFVDLVEASFDLAMPAKVDSALRVAIEESYEKGDAAHRQLFLGRVESIQTLRRLVREKKVLEAETGLMAFRRSLDAMLHAVPPSPTATILRDVLRGRHETAWAGEPPLNEAAVDSWLALAAFTASVALNQSVAPTTGRVEVAHRDLAALFKERDAAERKRLLRAHKTWIRLQKAWDDGGELKRLKLRAGVAEFVADILPEERRVELGEIEDLPGYARSAAVLREVVPAFDLWVTLASRPAEVLELIETWLGPVPEGEDVILLFRE